MKKRLFSILLVLCMALTMLPVTALAEATPAEANLIVSIPAPVVGFIPATKDSITISYQGTNRPIFSVEWYSYVMEKDAEGHEKVVPTPLQDNEKFEAGKKYLVHITHESIGRVADIEFTDATLNCYKEGGDGYRTLIFYETKVSTGHDHTYDKAWHDMGDRYHAHKCTLCGAFGAAEDHTYQNGKCTACGAADPNYVPPTDPAPVEPTPGGSVIIITPEATGPVFLSGANQTVALGSAAAFRIDYNYAAFRSVAVDGVTLTPADYTTWEGSTWVKLTPAYVKTLGIGTHTLSVYFDGATATTIFTVGSQPNPATGARDAVGIAAAAAVIALLGSAVILRKK